MPTGCPPAAPPRSSNPACGNAFEDPSTVSLGLELKPRPAAIAKSARKANAATIQGSVLVFSRDWGAAAPAMAPHLWQNRAPGLNSAPQEAQEAPTNGAPQLAQYRPEPVAPHETQTESVLDAEEGDVMRSTYTTVALCAARVSTPVSATPGTTSRGISGGASNHPRCIAPMHRRLSVLLPSCPRLRT